MARGDRAGARLGLALLGLVSLSVLVRRAIRRLLRRPVVDPEAIRAGHERSDLSMGAVGGCLVGLGLSLLVIFIGLSWWYAIVTGVPFQARPPSQGLAAGPAGPTPPAPRLETTSGDELRRLRAAEEERLHTYGWIDRERGIVRIPIERAIDLVAARGLPARPDGEAAQYRDHGLRAPSDASSGRMQQESWP